MTQIRSPILARSIHKLFQIYWYIFRPDSYGVKIILKSADNKFLLVRLTYFPNTWTFPGGGASRGEDIFSAMQRELREEVGIIIEKQNLSLIGPLGFNHEYKKDTIYIFAGNSEEIKPIIDGTEVVESRWFSKNEFPTMGPNAKRIFEFYERNKSGEN